MHVRADASSDARLVRMILPGTGQTWTLPDASDGSLTVDGRRRRLGVRADGFVVDAVRVIAVNNGVELSVQMSLRDAQFTVVRHYALYRDAPVVEMSRKSTRLNSSH